jgi:hypothetical protein
VISVSKDPLSLIHEIKRDYILKGIGRPEYYLGGNVIELHESWHLDGIKTALGAHTYIKNVVEKYERTTHRVFPKFNSPMAQDYHPELEDSPLLNPKDASLYRGLIGSGNWLITLGRFDICYAINALAHFSMAPREGHLKAMYRVFGYLKRFQKGKLLVDASYPDHSEYPEVEYNWTEFYPDAKEEIPYDAPETRGECCGKKARITCYVDADHAHDKVTRRSVTGFLILVNNMPVKWVTKRQATVETSTYGSEITTARMATEAIMDIRYKLRMLGVPLDGPALMLGDNMSVILNTTVPSSPLKKKHQAVSYHRIREAIAAKVIRFAHIESKNNVSDCLTKPLPSADFIRLLTPFLFRRPPQGEGQAVDPNEFDEL